MFLLRSSIAFELGFELLVVGLLYVMSDQENSIVNDQDSDGKLQLVLIL